MPKKVLSEQQIAEIKAELASGVLPQKDLAVKYGVSDNRISQIKVQNQSEIEKLQEKALEKVTGDLIQRKDWLMLQLEQDLEVLRPYRSPDAVRTRTGIIKLAAELNGQMPPRMQVAIIPVQHVYEGIDVEQV